MRAWTVWAFGLALGLFTGCGFAPEDPDAVCPQWTLVENAERGCRPEGSWRGRLEGDSGTPWWLDGGTGDGGTGDGGTGGGGTGDGGTGGGGTGGGGTGDGGTGGGGTGGGGTGGGGTGGGGTGGGGTGGGGTGSGGLGAGEPPPEMDASSGGFGALPPPFEGGTSPLCDVSDGTPTDPVRVPCRYEAYYVPGGGAPELVQHATFLAWNVEGRSFEEVRAAIERLRPMIVMLQGVPRLDPRSEPPRIDMAMQLGRALRMDTFYFVEFDRRREGRGEVGIAMLHAAWGVRNLRFLRHRPEKDWWAEKGYLGGRLTLAFDAMVAGDWNAFYSVDLEWDAAPAARERQLLEVLQDANRAGRPVKRVLGGSLNVRVCSVPPADDDGYYMGYLSDCRRTCEREPVLQVLGTRGWEAAPSATHPPTFSVESSLGGRATTCDYRSDWLFYRGLRRPLFWSFGEAGSERFEGLVATSDPVGRHAGPWAVFYVPLGG